MNQAEKRVFLIRRLLDEDRRYRGTEIPADAYAQKRMLRSLMNIRCPRAIDAEFLTVQDEYLRQESKTLASPAWPIWSRFAATCTSGRGTSPGSGAVPLLTLQTAA